MCDDRIVLNYYETLLRESDILLLKGPYWLNDNIISFYFEYLSKLYSRYLFVSPEVTQCIKIIPRSQIKVFLDPLRPNDYNYVFFALNDNERPQAVGGTHWSLLVYSRRDRCVFHYDSSRGSNMRQAQLFTEKLWYYLGNEGEFLEVPCLQQRNGYDCGIHLLCNAHFIVKYLENHINIIDCPLTSNEIESKVKTLRIDLIELIDKLKKKNLS